VDFKSKEPYHEIDLSNEPFMGPVRDFVSSITFEVPKKYTPMPESKCSEEHLKEMMAGHVFEKNLVIIKYPEAHRLADSIASYFGKKARVSGPGHWYPVKGLIGWHTNEKNPGWRLYISYCQEPGKSYFRYRHPHTHKIITSPDKEWSFRLFKVTKRSPLWHCVYSHTNRYSIGLQII